MPTIVSFDGKTPKIADDVFIAPDAVIIGDVEIGSGSSIWFGCVLRGDIGPIRIGSATNLQEQTIVHLDQGAPTIIGDNVTIGHGAIIHGTRIEDGAQVGMGAMLLSFTSVGAGSMIAAGAVVPEHMTVPAGSIAMGIPARVRRETTDDEKAELIGRAEMYAARGQKFRALFADTEAEG